MVKNSSNRTNLTTIQVEKELSARLGDLAEFERRTKKGELWFLIQERENDLQLIRDIPKRKRGLTK